MLMLMMQNGYTQTPLRDTGGSMLDHSNSSSEGGAGAAGGPGGPGGQQQVTEAAMMNHHHHHQQQQHHRQDAQSQMMRTTPAVLINDDPFMMNMGRFSQQLAARSAGMNNSQTSSSFPLQAGEGGGLDNQKIIDDDVVVGGGNSTTTAASRAMVSSISMMNNSDQSSAFATLTTTNTSPPSPSMLHLHPRNHSLSSVTAAAERVSPGHRMAPGGRQSMRMFLSKMAQQSVVKGCKSLDAELDMNLPFPVKLHYILSNPKYKECISWLPHGRAWRIIQPKIFEKHVIPKFFRSAKYASFMRQVNGWAFTRITEGPDLNAYYHEMFLRGIPSLCFRMKRPPKVKSAAAAARNAAGAGQGTPDFYRIGRIAPLPKAEPFRPIAQDGTKGSSSSTEKGGGDDTPRYDIELLKIEDISPLRGGVGGNGGSGSGGGMMVEWPDPEPSSSTSPSGAGRSSLTFPGGDPLFAASSGGGGESGKDSTAQQTTAATGFGEDTTTTTTNDKYNEKTEDEIIRDLTKADIRYLAYQNQILLKHVGGGGSSSGHQPQPASSESNKSETSSQQQQQETTAADLDNMSI